MTIILFFYEGADKLCLKKSIQKAAKKEQTGSKRTAFSNQSLIAKVQPKFLSRAALGFANTQSKRK